jgi:hypothetical protein
MLIFWPAQCRIPNRGGLAGIGLLLWPTAVVKRDIDLV